MRVSILTPRPGKGLDQSEHIKTSPDMTFLLRICHLRFLPAQCNRAIDQVPRSTYRSLNSFPNAHALPEPVLGRALGANLHAALLIRNTEMSVTMFTDPDPFQELAYPNVLAAKRAIAGYLAIPLALVSRMSCLCVPTLEQWPRCLLVTHGQSSWR